MMGRNVDTFNITYTPPGGSESFLDWDETGIAWESDVKEKFKPRDISEDETNIGPGGFELPRVNNEHFIVWMRTAGLPDFKKLYARILNTNLKKGTILHLNILSVFPVNDFEGEKWVVFSTTSPLGGKNDFLGLAYIVVGVLCIILAGIFIAKHLIDPRPLGDMKYFNFTGRSKEDGEEVEMEDEK